MVTLVKPKVYVYFNEFMAKKEELIAKKKLREEGQIFRFLKILRFELRTF